MGIKKNKYIGVDVSKGTLDYWLSGALKSKRIKNSVAGCQKLAELCIKERVTLVIFEYTGGYEKLMADTLHAAGIKYSKVSPLKARRFAQTLGKLAKNDRIDAYTLHEYGVKIQPEATNHPDAAVEELKVLVSRRQQLVDLLTQEKNHLNQPLSNKTTKESVISFIQSINKEKKHLEQEMLKVISGSNELSKKYELLISFKGVKHVIATTLLAHVPELGTLSREQIAALIGVAPMDNQTGKYQGARNCKGGRAGVRKTLYMGTVAAIKSNMTFRRYYSNLKSRGKISMVAMTACMRKMIVTLNAILRDEKQWDDQRYFNAKYPLAEQRIIK